MAMPMAEKPAHTAMARPRSAGTVKTLLMIDRVAGMINAPPTPISARVTISCSAEPASADATEPAPKTSSPMLSARRRPKRSPRADAVIKAPAAGLGTQTLVDAGEVIGPRMPLVIVTDIDNAWANLFVPEPSVPRIAPGQAAVIITDAGNRLDGKVSFIARQAEFTPRNVQTADERSRLVYRIKIAVDNRNGILKPGMPVDAELALQ